MQRKLSKTINSTFSLLSQNATTSFRNASFVSEYFKEQSVSVVSLLIGIILTEEALATRIVVEMGVDRGELLKLLFDGKIVEVVGDTKSPRELILSEEVKDILRRAFDSSQKMAHVYVGTEHLMLAILLSGGSRIKKLKIIGLTHESCEKMLYSFAFYPSGILSFSQKNSIVVPGSSL